MYLKHIAAFVRPLILGTFLFAHSAQTQQVKPVASSTYAVLIAGHPASDSEKFTKNSVVLAYQTLIERGVPGSNILVLGEGFAANAFSPYVVKATPFKADELEGRLRALAKNPGNGQVIVYLAGHGDITGIAGATPHLTGGITADKMNEAVTRGLPESAQKLILVDTCFSGDFASTCAAKNRITLSSAGSWGYGFSIDKTKEGDASYNHHILSYHFFSALRGKYPGGDKVDADADGDGRVTFQEAFDWAELKGRQDEKAAGGASPWLGFPLGISTEYSPEFICNKQNSESGLCTPVNSSSCELVSSNTAELLKQSALATDALRVQGAPRLGTPKKPGDLDSNGIVSNQDIFIFKDILSRKSTASAEELKMADYNGDGKVDLKDLGLMRRNLVK